MRTRRSLDFVLAGGALVIAALGVSTCWAVRPGGPLSSDRNWWSVSWSPFIAGRKGRFRNEVYGWFAAGSFAPVFALIEVLIVRPSGLEPARESVGFE